MSEQSDTPRTDWAAREAGGSSSFAALGWRLARDLERELSVVKRERDEARADLGIERMRLVASVEFPDGKVDTVYPTLSHTPVDPFPLDEVVDEPFDPLDESDKGVFLA